MSIFITNSIYIYHYKRGVPPSYKNRLFFYKRVLYPVTFAFEKQKSAMMYEPVYHSGGHLLIVKYVNPFPELKVRGYNDAFCFVAVGYDC